MTTWTLTIPAPAQYLTANLGKNRHLQGRVTKAWRDTAYLIALAHKPKLPTGLQRVRIDAVLHFTTNRGRDLPNHVDAAKPCVDALGPPFIRNGKHPCRAPGFGLVPNDTPQHVDGPHVTFADQLVPAAYMVLTITDLTGEAVA